MKMATKKRIIATKKRIVQKLSAADVRKHSKADVTTGGYLRSLKRFADVLQRIDDSNASEPGYITLIDYLVDENDVIHRIRLPVENVPFDEYLDYICYPTNSEGMMKHIFSY